MIEAVRCDRCRRYASIDEVSFECAEISQLTGKCARYVAICDECKDKEKKAKDEHGQE